MDRGQEKERVEAAVKASKLGVVVDSNEASHHPKFPLSLGEAVLHLSCGDFAVGTSGGLLGVERKAGDNDLLTSYVSRRLHNQVMRMLDFYDISVLLIEGLYHTNKAGYLHSYKASHTYPRTEAGMWMDLLKYQAKGLFVVFSQNLDSTVKEVLRLKEFSTPKQALTKKVDGSSLVLDELSLQQIKGVGEKMARRIVEWHSQ